MEIRTSSRDEKNRDYVDDKEVLPWGENFTLLLESGMKFHLEQPDENITMLS